MVQLVFPEDINPRGTLYGGRGPVVLGAMDDLDFLTPVYLREIVTVSAQVEHIGRASLELGVEVHSEQPRTGIRRKTTSSHLAFIALDEHERPRPVGQAITPASPAEEAVLVAAAARRAARIARVRAAAAGEVPALADDTARSVRLARLVMPEDAISGTLMFAGRLLAVLDEVAAISVIRYCRLPTVTASIDSVYFYHPLRVGQIADVRGVLTHVGRSSMEVGIRVDGEEPRTGQRRHVCTAFLTMVHLDERGRPAPVPAFSPETPEERRVWQDAEARRSQRKARAASLREWARP